MKPKILIATFLGLISATAKAETISFPVIWKSVNEQSSAQDSSRLQTEALAASQSSASKHWLPRVYLDAKSFQTNEPGSSFFSILSQRSLSTADFSPDAINHPEVHTYTRGALGVDLALYEGGGKTAYSDLLKASTTAQQNTTAQIQVNQYAHTAVLYGSISALLEQKRKLQALLLEVQRLTKRYQLGSKSNPVGYSGLLGMRSVANRLQGALAQYESKINSYYSALTEMGVKNQQWSPESLDADLFVERYISANLAQKSGDTSFGTAAAQENAKASTYAVNMERARFLPRVGFFAEGSVFNGDRDTADAYMAGLYLQWNLYDPSQQGGARVAKLKSLAAERGSQALAEQERAERAALNEAVKALRETLVLLKDSDSILAEQAKITGTLFQNGSINALQITEVLNRRADLILQRGEIELNLIKSASDLITKEKFEIKGLLGAGAKNERQ